MEPVIYFSDSIAEGKGLCLLPISRILLEEPFELCSGILLYPPGYFKRENLNIVLWPDRDFSEISTRCKVEIDGEDFTIVEGNDLHWFKSASTQIGLDDFLNSALVCIALDIDWDKLLFPESHEFHLDIIKSASEKIEQAMDIVRFYQCNIVLPDTLPGYVGLLNDGPFSCAQFYNPIDHESYIIGGSILTHNIIRGIGLDMTELKSFGIIGDGEVGNICRQAMRMFSSALEANTLTSKFTQCISILEYLADPNEYIPMKDVKKEIAKHVANNKMEYLEIMEYFKYLTSYKDDDGKQKGIRTNVIHIGKRIEDVVGDNEEISNILKKLEYFIRKTINDFTINSFGDWQLIADLRNDKKRQIGV